MQEYAPNAAGADQTAHARVDRRPFLNSSPSSTRIIAGAEPLSIDKLNRVSQPGVLYLEGET